MIKKIANHLFSVGGETRKVTGIFIVDFIIEGLCYVLSVLLMCWLFFSFCGGQVYGTIVLIGYFMFGEQSEFRLIDVYFAIPMVIPFCVIAIMWIREKYKDYNN